MDCSHCRCLRRGSTKESMANPLITAKETTDLWTGDQRVSGHTESAERKNKAAGNMLSNRINPALLMPDDFIRINVCGTWYQPLRSTLARFPTTLLADNHRMRHYYVEFMKAYYFDRHRECFDSILYYYQSGGNLIRPTSVPMDMFIKEVKFYDIPKKDLILLEKREGYIPLSNDGNMDEEDLPKNSIQRQVWQFFEHPESSVLARCVAIFSMLVIVISITSFCLETVPKYHDVIYAKEDHHPHTHTDEHNNNSTFTSVNSLLNDPSAAAKVIKMIETVSIAWFTFEYLIRFISSPNKWKFLKSILNLIDFAAILPYFVTQAIPSKKSSPLAVIRVARLLRVFRVFKLSRHSKGLQVLGSALKASINELCMIVFLLTFGIIVFSSAIYYAEYDKNKVSTFESIPNTFWYTLVTMTTVGYGDHVPRSLLGKLLGGGAAIAGVLTVAMVVPVVDSNFDFFYKRDRLQEEQQYRTHASSRALSVLRDDDVVVIVGNGDSGGFKPNF